MKQHEPGSDLWYLDKLNEFKHNNIRILNIHHFIRYYKDTNIYHKKDKEDFLKSIGVRHEIDFELLLQNAHDDDFVEKLHYILTNLLYARWKKPCYPKHVSFQGAKLTVNYGFNKIDSVMAIMSNRKFINLYQITNDVFEDLLKNENNINSIQDVYEILAKHQIFYAKDSIKQLVWFEYRLNDNLNQHYGHYILTIADSWDAWDQETTNIMSPIAHATCDSLVASIVKTPYLKHVKYIKDDNYRNIFL